jgi:hypothetical protein
LNKQNNINKIDYIFWFTLILYTNPGGIQQALGIYKLFGQINLNDILFVILLLCYLFVSTGTNKISPISSSLRKYIIIFAIYYFIVFGYLTPVVNNSVVNTALNFIKLRFAFYSFAMFFFVFVFWQQSWQLFIKLFIFTSIFIFILFLQSFFTGFDILPTFIISRDFIAMDRNLLLSYGLMPFFTPIGTAILIFKSKLKYRNFLIAGFILMNVTWLVSLTRRHILGMFITIIIAALLYNYLFKPKLGKKLKILFKSVIAFGILLFIVNIFLPSYIEAGSKAIESAVYVIRFGENITGNSDERLVFFGRARITDEFYKSPFLGTGFDNLWRTSEGEQYGLEASDYPFQAALAMAGLIGCLMFLPIYMVLIKALYKDIKHFKRNPNQFNELLNLLLLSFIISFIFTLLQYMNWFFPVSNAGNETFFILVGFYFASRELYYKKFSSVNFNINKIEHVK